jgi:serine/threonine protein phosphatase 1
VSIFAISDIHGRIIELNNLLDFIEFQPTDMIVFLGDYIDRGSNSFEVIERLIEIKRLVPNSYFLMGNHEEMAIASKDDSDIFEYWMKYGGDKTLNSYPEGIPEEHWYFMSQLTPYLETESAIYVHAGLQEELPMDKQPSEKLRWDRLTKEIVHYTNKKIYCGHSSQASGFPSLYGDARCIECVGWLTAINVETDFVYQVNMQSQRAFYIQEHSVKTSL